MKDFDTMVNEYGIQGVMEAIENKLKSIRLKKELLDSLNEIKRNNEETLEILEK